MEMDVKKIRWVVLFWMGGLSTAAAGSAAWKSDFTFYGDNTEFFEPFRTGETILGQQGKSVLEAGLGPTAFVQAGVFADFRSASVNPSVTVKPLLSFEYRKDGTRLVMGALETRDRHGFLEPLEVTTLEFTRPVEYGFQWLEKDPSFSADLFLNWHQLNTPVEPETFDYGGVVKGWPDNPLSLEFQMHGNHVGGQLYYIAIENNWVYSLGSRWKSSLGALGTGELDAFGILSGELKDGTVGDTRYGGGGYLKASLAPGSGLEFFGIGWQGRDFYSKDGDANYSSYSQDLSYYKADRTYVEIGAKKEFLMEGGASFDAEFRVHFIDQYSAYSYRLAVYAPLEIGIPINLNHDQREDAKN